MRQFSAFSFRLMESQMRHWRYGLVLGMMTLASAAGAEVKQVTIAADGVLCLSCTSRLAQAIQRLDGVDKVHVRMSPTRAEVTTRAGSWVDAERLRGAIRSAGFKPGEVRYTIAGTLTQWQNQPALRLSGSERVVVLQAEPKAPAAFEQARQALPAAGNQTVEIEGQFVDSAAPGDRSAPAALRVRHMETKA